jgi:hypothetical protein
MYMIKKAITFWTLACLLPSLLISSLSFFLPMDNIGQYELKNFVDYELPFLVLSATLFVGVSTLIHGLDLALYEILRRKYFADSEAGKQWLIALAMTFCVYSVLFLFWILAGYTVNANFATIVLPVFFIFVNIAMRSWLSSRKIDAQIE